METTSARVTAATLALCLLGASPTVEARSSASASVKRAEGLATEAKAFFQGKLFPDAAAKFMEAYAISKHPTLVYNAARAYEEGGALKKAVALFSLYIGLKGADDTGRQAAQERRANLKHRLKAREKQAQAAAFEKARADERAREEAAKRAPRRVQPAPAQAPKRPSVTVTTNTDGTASLVALGPATAVKQRAPQRHLPMGWTVGSLVLVAASASSYGAAYHYASKVNLDDVVDASSADRYRASRDTAQRWQLASVVTGVAAAGSVAWTAWRWWTSGDAPSENASVAGVHARVGPRTMHLVLAW